MKKIVVFFIVAALLPSLCLCKDEPIRDMNFSSGVNLVYNKAKVRLGDSGLENFLNYTCLFLELKAMVFEDVSLGVLAGYNTNYYSDPVNFNRLPLTLQIGNNSHNSMILGANIRAHLLSSGYFSLLSKAEVVYFKEFQKEWPLQMPIILGVATIEQSLLQFEVEFLVKYEGLSGIDIYLGPHFNLLGGQLKASESLGDIEALEEMKITQVNPVGLKGGIGFTVFQDFRMEIGLNIISKFNLSVGLHYDF